MSAFSFLKKKSDALVPPPPPMAPVSRFDAKLPPLPPLTAPKVVSTPAPVTPAAPLPPPLPAPKPAAPIVPPALMPKPVAAPLPPPLPPMFGDKPKGDLPPISVQRVAPPVPVMQPELKPVAINITPAPTPKPAPQPPKLENSKLAKALEELSALDLDIPDVPAPAIAPPKPVAKPASHAAPVHTPAPQPAKQGIGPHFVLATHFDEMVNELHTMHDHLVGLQAKNEKLGMIETQTKAHLDALIGHHDYMQKHLLSVDEKLFKVN